MNKHFKINDKVMVLQDTVMHGYPVGSKLTISRIINKATYAYKVKEGDTFISFKDIKLIRRGNKLYKRVIL